MARPSAASNRIEPRLMPVKAWDRALPSTSCRSMAESAADNAALTAGLASASNRCNNSGRNAGRLFSPSALAALRRLASSSAASCMAARARSRLSRAWSSSVPARAFSIRGICVTSGSSNAARCSSLAASRCAPTSLPNSWRTARAASSAPRMRLLTMTSCASSFCATAAPVVASVVLPSSATISTCWPSTLTAPSASAFISAWAWSSGSAARRLRVAMRASPSPSTNARASAGVSACALAAPIRHNSKTQERSQRIMTLAYFFSGTFFLPLFSAM